MASGEKCCGRTAREIHAFFPKKLPGASGWQSLANLFVAHSGSSSQKTFLQEHSIYSKPRPLNLKGPRIAEYGRSMACPLTSQRAVLCWTFPKSRLWISQTNQSQRRRFRSTSPSKRPVFHSCSARFQECKLTGLHILSLFLPFTSPVIVFAAAD